MTTHPLYLSTVRNYHLDGRLLHLIEFAGGRRRLVAGGDVPDSLRQAVQRGAETRKARAAS